MADGPTTSRPHSRVVGKLRPSAWVVVATASYHRGDWFSTYSFPTFVLPKSLGLCSEETALRAARSIVDPHREARINDRTRRPAKGETLIYINVERDES